MDKNRYYVIGRIVVPLILMTLLVFDMGLAQARSMQNRSMQKTGKNEKEFVPLFWYTSALTSNSVYNKLITVSLDHVSLESAIREIAKKGGVNLSYRAGKLPNRTVTAKLTNVSVMEAVNKVLSGTDIKALGSPNNQIVLVRKSDSELIDSSNQIKQQVTISGRVIDSSTKEALPGVNIVIRGTTSRYCHG